MRFIFYFLNTLFLCIFSLSIPHFSPSHLWRRLLYLPIKKRITRGLNSSSPTGYLLNSMHFGLAFSESLSKKTEKSILLFLIFDFWSQIFSKFLLFCFSFYSSYIACHALILLVCCSLYDSLSISGVFCP